MSRRWRRHQGPRYLGRDKAHNEVCRRVSLYPGVDVWDTHDVGGGFPDVVVGFRSQTFLFEIKGASGKLTESEAQWFGRWRGHAKVAQGTADEIVDFILREIGFPLWEPGTGRAERTASEAEPAAERRTGRKG